MRSAFLYPVLRGCPSIMWLSATSDILLEHDRPPTQSLGRKKETAQFIRIPSSDAHDIKMAKGSPEEASTSKALITSRSQGRFFCVSLEASLVQAESCWHQCLCMGPEIEIQIVEDILVAGASTGTLTEDLMSICFACLPLGMLLRVYMYTREMAGKHATSYVATRVRADAERA